MAGDWSSWTVKQQHVSPRKASERLRQFSIRQRGWTSMGTGPAKSEMFRFCCWQWPAQKSTVGACHLDISCQMTWSLKLWSWIFEPFVSFDNELHTHHDQRCRRLCYIQRWQDLTVFWKMDENGSLHGFMVLFSQKSSWRQNGMEKSAWMTTGSRDKGGSKGLSGPKNRRHMRGDQLQ